MSESTLIGKTLGRYRILARIGAGGMGEVYRAHDAILRRAVALKVLPASASADPDRLRRFEQEAQATGALNHPNILAIYDFGEYEGSPFAVTELLEGETLRERLGAGGVPIQKAVEYGIQIARGLSAAHEKGIVHRDLKPENLFITNDAHVKILDFGVAKLMQPEVPEGDGGEVNTPTQTEAGVVLGTTGYMSPEQVRGGAIDQRSDLFALGCVLYEMVSGRRAFSGATPADTMSAILSHEPSALSTLNDAVPPDLDRAVRRCLEKNPRERFQTAWDLASELGRLTELQFPLKRAHAGRWLAPAGVRRVLKRRWARLTIGVGAGVAAVVVALGIAWLTVWRPESAWLGGNRALPVAVLPLRNLSEDPTESRFLTDGFGEQLTARLTDVQGLLVLPWLTTRGVDPSRPLPALARGLHTRMLVTGSYRTDGDSIHVSIAVVDGRTGYQRWARAFDRPMDDLLSVQSDIAASLGEQLKGRITPEEKSQLAAPAARNEEAWALYLRGSEYFSSGDPNVFSRAESFFERSLELDPRLAEAHVGLGAIHNAIYFGQLGPGERDMEIAREHFDKALEIKPDLVAALAGRLQIHLNRDEPEECLKIARKAEAMGSTRIEAVLLAGQAYAWGFMPDKAIPLLERAVELDPANPAALWHLVYSLQWTGQNQRAFQAGATYLNRFGEDTEVYLWMGVAAGEMGSPDKAAAMFDRAIEWGGESRDFRTDEVAAWFLLRVGKKERARKLLTHMASVLEERLAAYPTNVRVRSSLVEAYALLGRKADALRQLEILMPQISKPGYRDQSVPTVAVALLYAGCVREAKQVFDILRGGEIAGSWSECKSNPSILVLMADQPEFQRFRVEGEAAMAKLHAKYRG